MSLDYALIRRVGALNRKNLRKLWRRVELALGIKNCMMSLNDCKLCLKCRHKKMGSKKFAGDEEEMGTWEKVVFGVVFFFTTMA